jgi:hypothetical protein
MGYFTVFVGVVAGLVPSKLAGVELGCVAELSNCILNFIYQNTWF